MTVKVTSRSWTTRAAGLLAAIGAAPLNIATDTANRLQSLAMAE
jgi:hypothetical protein